MPRMGIGGVRRLWMGCPRIKIYPRKWIHPRRWRREMRNYWWQFWYGCILQWSDDWTRCWFVWYYIYCAGIDVCEGYSDAIGSGTDGVYVVLCCLIDSANCSNARHILSLRQNFGILFSFMKWLVVLPWHHYRMEWVWYAVSFSKCHNLQQLLWLVHNIWSNNNDVN